MLIKFSAILFCCLAITLVGVTAHSQHSADRQFNSRVESPAFTKNFPRVLFDEAHYNAETVNGRYRPFADLLFSDGYQIVANRQPFTKGSLQTFKILVIVNPLGAEDTDDEGAEGPAFTPAECETVANWIRGGGSLLLIADLGPFASASEILATRLEVEMHKGYTTDPANGDKESNEQSDNSAGAGVIVYSRENKLLTTHAITNGRNEAERVNRAMTFMGQSLKGPAGSDAFLKLADTAVDNATPQAKNNSAAGRAQGVAYRLGKGRVVVLGDAAILTAQVTGSDNRPFGMNTPGVDNKQLALNIMHWLSGLLK